MKKARTPALALGRDRLLFRVQLWVCLLCEGREDHVGGRHQEVPVVQRYPGCHSLCRFDREY